MVTLTQARTLALSLMAEHGLLADGWRFAWSHARRQLGCCRIARRRDRVTGRVTEIRTIALSRHLVRLNADGQVRDTILHEIAHALAGLEHGHDRVWQATCRRIGAAPLRVAGAGVAMVEPPLELWCGRCRRVLAQRFRRMAAARLKRVYCQSCGPGSQGLVQQRLTSDSPRLTAAASQ